MQIHQAPKFHKKKIVRATHGAPQAVDKIFAECDPVASVDWFRAPMNPFDKSSIVMMHRSWSHHPLVGLGLGSPKPLNGASGTPQMTYSEAFRSLFWHPCIRLEIPGHGRNAGTFVLNPDDHSAIPNVSYEWNWRPLDARNFLSDLADEGMIDDELLVALTRAIGRQRRSERDAVPKATRAAVMAKTSGKCVYCACILTTTAGYPHSYQPDHVLPVVKGGSDDVANLIPSCASCNARKRAKTLVQFAGVCDD